MNRSFNKFYKNIKNIKNYHTNVLDHYENPKNVGYLDKNNKNVGTGLVGAPACGDVMRLQIEVENGKKMCINCLSKLIKCK